VIKPTSTDGTKVMTIGLSDAPSSPALGASALASLSHLGAGAALEAAALVDAAALDEAADDEATLDDAALDDAALDDATLEAADDDAALDEAGALVAGTAVAVGAGGMVGGTAAVGRGALVGSGVGAHATIRISIATNPTSRTNFFISSPPRECKMGLCFNALEIQIGEFILACITSFGVRGRAPLREVLGRRYDTSTHHFRQT
jgi:hypothetical protein